MRKLSFVCAGILALSFLAAPASADTTNTVFAVFDFGGFSGDGSGEQYESFNFDGTDSLFIVNLASIPGGFFDFSLVFNELDLPEGIDLSDVSYFIIGEAEGSEHLILSANEPGLGLDDDFEAGIESAVIGMGDLRAPLGTAGGSSFVSPDDFGDHFGTPITTFTEPNPLIPFGTTLSVDGGAGDILGFSDPTVMATDFSLSFDPQTGELNVQYTPAPEPGLAILVALGLGAVIARRRRRAAA